MAPVPDARSRDLQNHGHLGGGEAEAIDVRVESGGPCLHDAPKVIYTERDVNGVCSVGFRNNHTEQGNFADVPSIRAASNRDEAVAGYVRSRLKDLEKTRARGWQVEFARTAGFVPSVVAQVKRGLGVGAKTGPGWAKALGFKDFDELKDTAYRWAVLHGGGQPLGIALPVAATEAIEWVLALNEGTQEQLVTIAEAYCHPRFAQRDRKWWIQRLLEELRADADADHEIRRSSHAARTKQARVKRPK